MPHSPKLIPLLTPYSSTVFAPTILLALSGNKIAVKKSFIFCLKENVATFFLVMNK